SVSRSRAIIAGNSRSNAARASTTRAGSSRGALAAVLRVLGLEERSRRAHRILAARRVEHLERVLRALHLEVVHRRAALLAQRAHELTRLLDEHEPVVGAPHDPEL